MSGAICFECTLVVFNITFFKHSHLLHDIRCLDNFIYVNQVCFMFFIFRYFRLGLMTVIVFRFRLL